MKPASLTLSPILKQKVLLKNIQLLFYLPFILCSPRSCLEMTQVTYVQTLCLVTSSLKVLGLGAAAAGKLSLFTHFLVTYIQTWKINVRSHPITYSKLSQPYSCGTTTPPPLPPQESKNAQLAIVELFERVTHRKQDSSMSFSPLFPTSLLLNDVFSKEFMSITQNITNSPTIIFLKKSQICLESAV